MAPKRKRPATDSCKPRPKKCCPNVSEVPRLIVKGGIEVLGVCTGADSITQIELYLNPRMGVNDPDIPTYGDWYTYSYDMKPAHSKGYDKPNPENLPAYSVARVQLPMLNEDITCDTLQMWEAVSVKTEVVGVNSLINVHYWDMKDSEAKGAGEPIQGLNYHMFAVGGEPLDLQGLQLDYSTKYPQGNNMPINIETVTGKPTTPRNQGLDPTAKTKLLKDGFYPIEVWGPDPSRNENSRYYGSIQTGTKNPTVLQFTNTLNTVLLDENGVGPLCKGDGLFVSAADICGFLYKSSGAMAFHGLPRYFNVTLRKRWVKNPYPVTSLLSSLFNTLMPNVKGQPMAGKDNQVEEVRIYQGTEELPGDPNLVRYIDQFGQKCTGLPTGPDSVPPTPVNSPCAGPSCAE
ncbi:major structural protein VP1 [Eidolon polyomavirus 1]|uniref:Major structural protein VP1 n=1 Tax=Eidolon polyomavirus 1 TaxID=1891722 RepID=L0G8J8_9POLY|nr:major structural protein VP1 [Eidolon polyomavirus 1]AGA82589.1 major structural protein VP1 [Eidolon polyomavirus 1]